ncbi:septum site-determining protein MinC [Kingella negevensis]|uniref:Probable septum site-determining protein MinC n=1 Tax=Kingella negevensis TaxID=1522312 RepID=A0A238HHJ2_9NEIS|nr:septum site-determining protein MinC [Kingella negevensis]MDK4684336.1 septum site-determining protein MinC [Kingella negevensis]MDK4697602.1 septum site-determining protein MinC [Kingella negevensis]SNB61532.1 Septum site-determining protein MinC [Kingella negevensis]
MKAAFELKSARLRLEALTLRLFSAQLDEIKQLLTDKAEQYQMFTSMPFILDASSLKTSDNLDVKAVVALFAEHGLRVVALRHEEAHWADIARETGLLWLQSEKAETQVSQPENADAVEETAETQPENTEAAKETEETEQPESSTEDKTEETETQPENSSEEQTETSEETQPENAETSAEEPEKATPVLELTARPTLVITHPVRTGQQIYAEKADLIVLGMVSEGAEVIADGNIHIYAPMRGRALAGESGDQNARIFMQSMQAELVSIAGIYRVFEQDLPPHLHKQAVQISLDNERLVIAAIEAR